jgi:hypothetical protein
VKHPVFDDPREIAKELLLLNPQFQYSRTYRLKREENPQNGCRFLLHGGLALIRIT